MTKTAHVAGVASKYKFLPDLETVMDYQNAGVIARLQKQFSMDETTASELFNDTKRFLWLCSLCDGPIAPAPKIDDGWHTFIIFTEDYAGFCDQFFGNFIHHRPRGPNDPHDGGIIVRRTIAAIETHLGGFQSLSANWSFPHLKEGGACSSDSVSCAPSPSCDN